MAGVLRNEVEIELSGEKRVMRASFAAIALIERQLGKSMTSIINKIAGGDLSVTEAVTIIHHGLRGYDDKRLSFDQVGDAVMERGMNSDISIAVVEFAQLALNGVSVGKPEEAAPTQ